jgi:hypothetical protein
VSLFYRVEPALHICFFRTGIYVVYIRTSLYLESYVSHLSSYASALVFNHSIIFLEGYCFCKTNASIQDVLLR